jgi:hypothetical protein
MTPELLTQLLRLEGTRQAQLEILKSMMADIHDTERQIHELASQLDDKAHIVKTDAGTFSITRQQSYNRTNQLEIRPVSVAQIPNYQPIYLHGVFDS